MHFSLICFGIHSAVAMQPHNSLSGNSDPGSSLTLRAEYGENFFARIGADFINNQHVPHPGTIKLDFSYDFNPRTDEFVYRFAGTDYGSVLIGGDRGVSIDLNEYAFHANITNPVMYLQIGPRSPLMVSDPVARPRGYLLAPISATEADFVINPENPLDHAFGGEIFYAPRNPDPEFFWIVPAAVRLIPNGSDNEQFHEPPEQADRTICAVFDESMQSRTSANVARNFAVPHRIREAIISLLSDRGVSESSFVRRLDNFNESIFDTLPTIQFMMETDEFGFVNLAVLEPRQYIREMETGRYSLRLQATNPTNQECALNRPLLQKLVIHFDIENGRIGFGEPLIDL